MDVIPLISVIISFLVSWFILPRWIKRAKFIGLSGKDMNKRSKPDVAEFGGIAVIAGFTLGLLVYVAIKTFYFKDTLETIKIFAILSVVLILAFIGMVDSLLAAISRCGPGGKNWRKGLRKRYRILLCLFAAIPLMVINAGHGVVSLPVLGEVDLGWIYPFILIPIGITGASTTFNFLAGYNGLEAGQGVLIIGALSIVAVLTGNSWLALVGLCMIASLLAFLKFNWFPAKVFPSDVLTYPIGALIAIFAIVGNMERIAIFFFIPYIIEVALKSRGKLVKQSYGVPNKDNSLEMPYEKIYGIEHFAIWFLKKVKKRVFEKDVVYLVYTLQILVIIIGFVVFRKGILS